MRTTLSWIASILVGLCAAPLAAVIVGTAADSWAKWLHISSHEGGSAYFVVFVALLAVIVALIAGIAIARGWLLSTPHFLSALGTTVGAIGATALLITGIIWLAADLPPTIDGRPIEILAEVRFPPGSAIESAQNAQGYVTIVRVAAGESSGIGYFDVKAVREMDGRIVLPVRMTLSTSTAKKLINVAFTDGPSMFFPMHFGSKPAPEDLEWSGWLAPGDTSGAKGYELRYRAHVVPPPPPMPTAEQEAVDADAQQEAEMRALAPDAPLASWLLFTRYGTPQARIDAAIAAIRARPNYAAEMAHEMLEGEYDSSRDALRAVAHIHPPPAELAAGIAAVGKEIAGSLRVLEKETPGSEAYNKLVDGISTRFSAWMEATRPLQEAKVADFTPQLEEIIEPARRLDQSHVIRIDVVRVASFYLNQWAGIAPLPTDPPPR